MMGKLSIDLAEESKKTKRAREKIEKKDRELSEQITDKEKKKKTVEIHRWIARHAADRVILKTKSISLFDENKNAASFSNKILSLKEKVQLELETL